MDLILEWIGRVALILFFVVAYWAWFVKGASQ